MKKEELKMIKKWIEKMDDITKLEKVIDQYYKELDKIEREFKRKFGRNLREALSELAIGILSKER